MKKKSTPMSWKMEALMGPDPLTEALRGKAREVILTLIAGELEEVLAALPYVPLKWGQSTPYRCINFSGL